MLGQPLGLRGRTMAACLLWTLVASLGCSASETTTAPRGAPTQLPRPASPETRLDASAAPVAPAAQPLERAPRATRVMRVSALAGSVRTDAPLTVGSEVGRDARLELGRAARLTLTLDDHVEVEIVGPALVRVLPDGEPALLLREGRLAVDVAPRGMRGHTAFWLATPLARIDVVDSARLVTRAGSTGAGELLVVSGHAYLAQADQAQLLRAGAAHCIGLAGPVPLPRGAATMVDALQRVSGAACSRSARGRADARAPMLEAALELVQAHQEQELAQLAEHTRRISLGGQGAEAMRRGLAHSAAQLARERGRAAALRAQLEAGLLADAPSAAHGATLARAAQLAPYTL